MAKPKGDKFTTFANIDDIRTICPRIGDFLKPYLSEGCDAEDLIKRSLKLANIWIKNQLEQSELNTFASANEKMLVEANYATFLVLRGTLRGERSETNNWMFSYREDAEKLLQHIVDKASARPGLSSRTKRIRKSRVFFPDYGNDDFPFNLQGDIDGD